MPGQVEGQVKSETKLLTINVVEEDPGGGADWGAAWPEVGTASDEGSSECVAGRRRACGGRPS